MSSSLENGHNLVWTKMITVLDPGLGMHTRVLGLYQLWKRFNL